MLAGNPPRVPSERRSAVASRERSSQATTCAGADVAASVFRDPGPDPLTASARRRERGRLGRADPGTFECERDRCFAIEFRARGAAAIPRRRADPLTGGSEELLVETSCRRVVED